MSGNKRFLQRTPLPKARALLLAGVAPVGDEDLSVDDAAGRVVSEDVVAKHPAPHYRASAMDGIAVRAADTFRAAESPVVLHSVPAGSPPPEAPSCVAVDTGSLLPDWTDAVIRIEDATVTEDGYRIRAAVPPGRDVRRAGEDIEAGTLLLPAGSVVRPADLGALLSTGITRLRVRRAPRVAILATGAEVVEPQQGGGPGQVIESNSRVIAAMVEQWGGRAHRLGIVADDEASLERAVRDAARRFDAVAVLAGSSAGRKDFTVTVLEAMGELLVQGVDIAPGRPVALARVVGNGDAPATPVLAIPGYPVAAIVVCEQLLRPLIAALLGTAEPVAPTLSARVLRKIPSRLGMDEFRRVLLTRQRDSSYVLALLPSGAGSISTVTRAHAWLRIGPTVEGVDEGSQVDVELMVSRSEVDAAFVLAGTPGADAAVLERHLRSSNPRARVLALGLASGDAMAAVERGEAHGAFLTAEAAVPPSLRLLPLPGFENLRLVVRRDGSGTDFSGDSTENSPPDS